MSPTPALSIDERRGPPIVLADALATLAVALLAAATVAAWTWLDERATAAVVTGVAAAAGLALAWAVGPRPVPRGLGAAVALGAVYLLGAAILALLADDPRDRPDPVVVPLTLLLPNALLLLGGTALGSRLAAGGLGVLAPTLLAVLLLALGTGVETTTHLLIAVAVALVIVAVALRPGAAPWTLAAETAAATALALALSTATAVASAATSPVLPAPLFALGVLFPVGLRVPLLVVLLLALAVLAVVVVRRRATWPAIVLGATILVQPALLAAGGRVGGLRSGGAVAVVVLATAALAGVAALATLDRARWSRLVARLPGAAPRPAEGPGGDSRAVVAGLVGLAAIVVVDQALPALVDPGRPLALLQVAGLALVAWLAVRSPRPAVTALAVLALVSWALVAPLTALVEPADAIARATGVGSAAVGLVGTAALAAVLVAARPHPAVLAAATFAAIRSVGELLGRIVLEGHLGGPVTEALLPLLLPAGLVIAGASVAVWIVPREHVVAAQAVGAAGTIVAAATLWLLAGTLLGGVASRGGPGPSAALSVLTSEDAGLGGLGASGSLAGASGTAVVAGLLLLAAAPLVAGLARRPSLAVGAATAFLLPTATFLVAARVTEH